MSYLETLKNKLKVKPGLQSHKIVEVVFPKERNLSINELISNSTTITPQQPINNPPMDVPLTHKIIDERNSELGLSFNRENLKQKLRLRNNFIVKEISNIPKEPAPRMPKFATPYPKNIKKITKKIIIIDEDDEEEEERREEEEKDEEIEKEAIAALENNKNIENKNIEKQPKQIHKNDKKKLPKGVVILSSPHDWRESKELIDRLPNKSPLLNIKVSSYYMNNREIFINFINSLFEPYRQEIQNASNDINCDNLLSSENDNLMLLTHQKVIRDYMNLYTPYRGLLLYHGLGSGKTLSSIAIAEGMKNSKKIIVMLPASLKRNYIEELKKGGDLLYKKNQYWEWIPLNKYPEYTTKSLSYFLNLPASYIENKNGVWLVDIRKESNYDSLSSNEQFILNEQINEMIKNKYSFINYNGLRRKKLAEMTSNFEKNIFDNAVVIIDEAHNFISRIVNKIKSEKDIPTNKRGEKEHVYKSLSMILYEFLLRAQNCRIVLLTGTPIINYPNEIAILFNILRGYIKTWEIPLEIKTKNKINKETLQTMFLREKLVDYIDYSPSSNILYITRNPFGFKNKIKENSGYQGVSNEKRNEITGEKEIEMDYIDDDYFEKKIIKILKTNQIDIFPTGIKVYNYKALPDDLDIFSNKFIDPSTKHFINENLFKRRIVGLTSYFRSAKEELLPRYEKTPLYYHVLNIPMSDYQFDIYEKARQKERELEKSSKKKKTVNDDLYKEPSGTYRIFSRLFCNFVMPEDIERPLPEKSYENIIKDAKKEEKEQDLTNEEEGEIEGDYILNKIGDANYENRLKETLYSLKQKSSVYLSKEMLEIYSPKYLSVLDNIQDPQNIGLHLVYSQFRTLEGIGIFMIVLEENGFSRFKIKKSPLGSWELDIQDEEWGKPMFALYTGTELEEEKEIIRNIYNGNWLNIPVSILNELQKRSENNNLGEIIKVLMITSSGSEGINLRNTRFVHIMEPYWHPVRIEQVIGRARRICSHKDLPIELQTVEVFIYLMVFTKKQIDLSISLRVNDLSKRTPHIPFSSDQALYEISSIKEETNMQIIKSIKESSIDCAIYSKNSNEGLQCLSFGEPKNSKFSYEPNIEKQPNDMIMKVNKEKIEWRGKPVNILGVSYVSRKMSKNMYNIYDLESYQNALENPNVEPRLIGTVEIKDNGEKVFKSIIG